MPKQQPPKLTPNDPPAQPTHATRAEQPNKPAEKQDRNTGHPLLKNSSRVMDALERLSGNTEEQAFQVEKLDEWKDTVNRLASTNDGQYFLQMLVKFSGYTSPANTANTVKMVENAGKSAFYLTYVRPYLDKQLRSELE